FNISLPSLKAYIEKIRQHLGSVIPPLTEEIFLKNSFKTVIIDGITVPKSIHLLSKLIADGKYDYSMAKPFIGT
ncbi:hypothetical protein PENTCL1PPCAC_23615, partial [Pristionchus entomophagus]